MVVNNLSTALLVFALAITAPGAWDHVVILVPRTGVFQRRPWSTSPLLTQGQSGRAPKFGRIEDVDRKQSRINGDNKMVELTAETLLNVGFRDVAKWVQASDGNGIDYLLDGANAEAHSAMLEVRSALYAFVQGGKVNYIGKTARSIKKRFVGYCNPGKTQLTNVRCHSNIKALLKEGEEIRILVLTPISDLRYGEFQIDLAAGLEESLIVALSTPWNGREGKRPVTEEAEREATEEIEAAPTSPPYVVPSPSACDRQAKFQIKLSSAYYNQGFINPGVDASRFLGAGGDPVILYLGKESEQVASVINRTANANGSVRIVGNNRLIAEWFQRHFRLGDVVEAIIQDRQHIWLREPG